MNVFQYSLEHYIIRITEHALRIWNATSMGEPTIDYIIDIRDDIDTCNQDPTIRLDGNQKDSIIRPNDMDSINYV